MAVAAAAFAATPPAGTSYVSDLPWLSATNGWGPAERNTSNGEAAAGDGGTLSIGSKTYPKGIGAHAPSDIALDLGGACSTFTADVGIDNEAGGHASVVFQVWADGTKLYDSGTVLKTGVPIPVNVGIDGRSQLHLVVTDAGDGITNDHGDWANAQVACGGGAVPPGAISVSPGTDLPALVSSSPAAQTFYIRAGVHRFGPVQPKDGDQFIGESGAVLSGSKVLGSFTTEGSYWVATGQFQNGVRNGVCDPGFPRCDYPEDLFIDGVPLHHVASLGDVKAGSWFFDYNARKIYFADNPNGHLVETSVTPYAFYGTATGVVIQNLTIERYANPGQTGAILPKTIGPGPTGRAWVLKQNTVQYNHAGGVFMCDNLQVLNSNIHHNGQVGLLGGGASILVQGNEIAYNNILGFNYSSWEGGGTKFVGTTNLVVTGNYSHHNVGPGFAIDGFNTNVLFDGNRTTSNRVAGIFYEIGGAGVIRNNTIDSDGYTDGGSLWYGAGIMIASSTDVEVYGNTVTNCQNGIGASYVDRGDIGRPYILQNLYVHDNQIKQVTGTAAGIVSSFPSAFSLGNRFQHNTYTLSNPNGKYFEWNGSSRTKNEWQAFGNDTTGSFQ